MSSRKKNKQHGSSTTEEESTSQSLFETINSKLDHLISEVAKNNQRLENLEVSQKKMENSVEFLHDELAAYKVKINKLEQNVEALNNTIESFKNLEARVNASEHQDRARCIELNGIPPSKDENLMAGLEKMLKHLKITSISVVTDIDKIYRIRDSKRVIVKFIQSTKRDTFFQSYRKNIMLVSELGFVGTGQDKIYVNEVLSAAQSKLFWQTRNFKTTHKYKYVWTFRQKIYIRKTQDSDAININSEDDLNALTCT